jgi:poly(A) polymerase
MNLADQSWLHAPATQQLLAAFASADTELRFVGGCVRDAVMGRAVKDIDAATPALPERTMELLKAAGIKVIPTGLRHGTITAVIEHKPYEITTLRTDSECDGRHAQVTFTDDWQEDAARRDFTMNALYCDARGEITDFFSGINDANTGRIRFIGDASARIQEDALRILRFFRFFATHGIAPADEAALAACRYHVGMIDGLSGERIQHEMFRLLTAPDPSQALELMHETVLPVILQFTPSSRGVTAGSQTMHDDMAAIIRLAVMVRSADNPTQAVETLTHRWKLSNRDKHQLRLLVTAEPLALPANEVMISGWLRRYGRDMTQALLLRDHLEAGHLLSPELAQAVSSLPIPEFPVDGADLLAAGIPQGPQLGEALKRLEAHWVASRYRLNKQALIALL